jgi:hypothetical protein
LLSAVMFIAYVILQFNVFSLKISNKNELGIYYKHTKTTANMLYWRSLKFPWNLFSMPHHETFSASTSQYITAVVRALFSYLSSYSYKRSNERLDILNLSVTEHDQISHVNCWHNIIFPLEKINIILQK